MGYFFKKSRLWLLASLGVSAMETQDNLIASQRVVATLLALDGYAEALIGIKKKLADLDVFSGEFDFSRIRVLVEHSKNSISPKFKNRLEGYFQKLNTFYFYDVYKIPYSADLLFDEEVTMDERLFGAIEARKILPNSLLVQLLSKHVALVLTTYVRDDALAKNIEFFNKKVASPEIVQNQRHCGIG